MKRQTVVIALVSCMLCGMLPLSAADGQEENLLPILEQAEIEPIFAGSSSTINLEGTNFYPIHVPELLRTAYASQDGIQPGERDEQVQQIKTLLAEKGAVEFVAHSQLRTEVADLFDSHLQVLVETLYDFCGLDQEASLDPLTLYLLEQLPELPQEMQQDVYQVYKARMIQAGIDGILLRNGESLGLYYMAQTDPDWASLPFTNLDNPREADDTMYDRACGVMSMTMVASAYLHQEVDPLPWIDYVVENGYRVSVAGVDERFFQTVADFYDLPEPEISYQTPQEGQSEIDWDRVCTVLQENNGLAIVHMYPGGGFTAIQHYMVLADYQVIDGVGYFLVEDPFQSRSRYDAWGTDAMLDPGLGEEGITWVTPEEIANTCYAVTLFPEDYTVWDVNCQSTAATLLPLGE